MVLSDCNTTQKDACLAHMRAKGKGAALTWKDYLVSTVNTPVCVFGTKEAVDYCCGRSALNCFVCGEMLRHLVLEWVDDNTNPTRLSLTSRRGVALFKYTAA